MALSESIEDYLKSIYEIESKGKKVSTSQLSEKLEVAPASVTSMVKKLSEKKLVTHKKYQGVKLTKAGLKIALEMVRHHRLIELYLNEALGVPWDQVHEEAEKWEHVLSEDIEDRIDQYLGHPKSDPHGSPIPERDGTMITKDSIKLIDVSPVKTVLIAEVSDHDPELLRYFGNMGLYPESEVKVISIEPFQGPVTLVVKGEEFSIGREAAKYIKVMEA